MLGIALGQTKEETIAWLKEKFEKYLVSKEYTVEVIKDMKLVSIDACSFTITSVGIRTNDSGEPHYYSNTFPTDIVSIQTDNAGKNGYFDYGKDEKGMDVKKVLCVYDGVKSYRSGDWVGIQLFFGGEENIRERIEKALKHLATFCPKKKETF